LMAGWPDGFRGPRRLVMDQRDAAKDSRESETKAVGDGAEAEVEGFEDGLAAGMGTLFHAAFQFAGLKAFLNSILAAFQSAILVKFLGEGHGGGAVGFRTD